MSGAADATIFSFSAYSRGLGGELSEGWLFNVDRICLHDFVVWGAIADVGIFLLDRFALYDP